MSEDDFYDGLARRGGLCPNCQQWMHDCTCPNASACNCDRCRQVHKLACPDCGHTITIVTDRYNGPWRWARHTPAGDLTGRSGEPECTNSGARYVPRVA